MDSTPAIPAGSAEVTSPYIGIFDSLDPKWRPPVQLIYLASLRRTFEVFGDHFSPHMQRITETLGWRAAAYMGDLATGPRAFGHGDYRLDNMFFGPGPDDLAVIDWQVCGGNNPLGDVAYFLGGSLPVELRRSVERDAVAEYHETLRQAGVEGIGLEDCWRLYRQNMFVRMLVIVISAGVSTSPTSAASASWGSAWTGRWPPSRISRRRSSSPLAAASSGRPGRSRRLPAAPTEPRSACADPEPCAGPASGRR